MRPENPDGVTQLMQRVAAGDPAAASELLPLLYGELHAVAERMMRGQGRGHTLQPTALIHEAWMKLVGESERKVATRAQFVAFAARAMRSVLVDHARRKRTQKRGGAAQRVALDTLFEDFQQRLVDVLALDEVLGVLSAMDADLGRIVELRFFAGLSIDETAAVLDVSVPTVVRRWHVARMWLWRELHGAGT
jgi:RNA polymerase sigma factor (TIGR02999 family)